MSYTRTTGKIQNEQAKGCRIRQLRQSFVSQMGKFEFRMVF